jgi:hypothetical protein
MVRDNISDDRKFHKTMREIEERGARRRAAHDETMEMYGMIQRNNKAMEGLLGALNLMVEKWTGGGE